jgi:hypothetical protein
MNLTIIVIICCALELIIESYLSWQKDESIMILPKSDCSTCDDTNDKCKQECMMKSAQPIQGRSSNDN